ncbi:MAG: SCO family protein [Nitrosomonadales bacterium]|nr:MAG: SCO family protein [Nitrosomonadales bacterium]
MPKFKAFLLVAAALGAAAAWLLWPHKQDAHTVVLPVAERPLGGDFTLQTADGPVSLHDLHGKVVLLYFGYAKCPDVCPTSLSMNAQALTALTPEERSKTRLLFISVDPERDTPASLKAYAAYFHPEMIAATGSLEQVAAVARAYGVGYAKRPPQADGSYAVDHSAQTYVIAPDGRLADMVAFGSTPDKVVDAVRKFLP